MNAFNRFRTTLLLFAATLVLTPIGRAQQPQQVGGQTIKTATWNGQQVQYLAEHISVKLAPGVTQSQVASLLAQHNATIVNNFDDLQWGLVELPPGQSIFPVISSLESSSLVAVAEPNMLEQTTVEPGDPYFQGTGPASYAHQWALKNTGQTPPGGTNDADIDAPEAWNLTEGRSEAVVAILDSGIPMQQDGDEDWDEDDLSHPDLDKQSKIILGEDYAPYGSGDGSGVRDELGHGTHVAGIAAAETDNGSTGIAGTSWNSRVLVIQVFDQFGGGSSTAFYKGVKYAADYADNNDVPLVVNYSGGGDSSSKKTDAITYAQNRDVLIVAAAGNEGGPVEYPAAYSSSYSNVVAVSATGPDDVQAGYSSEGPEVNVAAPGGYGGSCSAGTSDDDDIFSTTPNYSFSLGRQCSISQDYGYMYGTSMAAPHVAGTAALMLAVQPSLTPSEIRNGLETSAETVPAMNGQDFTNEYGHGRLNAYDAVRYTLENHGGTLGGSGETVRLSENLTIQNDDALTVRNGTTLEVTGNADMFMDGNFTIGDDVDITFDNNSDIKVRSSGSVTVNGGSAGTSLTFSKNGDVTVSGGDFDANNATFTNASGKNWVGIEFASGSKGTIENSTIEGVSVSSWGAGAVTINGTDDPRVKHSIIQNITGGGSALAILNGAHPYIYANTVINDNGNGISSDNASAHIEENYVSASNSSSATSGSAAYFVNSASPFLGDYGNTFKDSYYGIYADGDAYVYLACCNNRILGNAYKKGAYAVNNSSIDTERSWWGSGTTGAAYTSTYADNTSSIDYKPVASSDPGPHLGDPSNNSPNSSTRRDAPVLASVEEGGNAETQRSQPTASEQHERLRRARVLRHEGKPGEALALYEKVLAEAVPSSPVARRALVGIGTGYRESGNAAMREAVEEQADRSGPLRAVALELLLNSHIARGNRKAGLRAADALVKQFAGTEHAAYARANRFFLHFRAGDRTAAKKALSAYTARHDASKGRAARRAGLAQWLLERRGIDEPSSTPDAEAGEHAAKAAVSDAPERLQLKAAYPNPAQGRATVPLALPEAADVRVAVYDVLGRRMRTLASGEFAAGEHRFALEAGDLPSGVYVVRARVQSSSSGTKVFTRKVTLAR